MLTVMAIMSVVMTGLTTLFVNGSNAQLDLNRRFEAQQRARVALDRVRREIHCADGGSVTPATGGAPTLALHLPSQCPTAVGGAATDVTWCSVLVSTGRYKLYRKVGTTCNNTGVAWADYLTQANLFEFQATSTTSGVVRRRWARKASSSSRSCCWVSSRRASSRSSHRSSSTSALGS